MIMIQFIHQHSFASGVVLGIVSCILAQFIVVCVILGCYAVGHSRDA